MSVHFRAVVAYLALLVALSFPGLSIASAHCANNTHEITAPDGARFITNISSYTGLGDREALAEVRRIAVARGYLIAIEPDYSSPAPGMGIGKPPSPNPTMIQLDHQTYAISFTTIVSPGAQADIAEVRVQLCDLVDEFESGRAAAPRQDRPNTADMGSSEDPRTTIPEEKPRLNLLKPSAPFDLVAAKDALKPGHSIIRGQACGGWEGNLVYGSQPILLYPVTPYLEQLIALDKKADPVKDRVITDPQAVATRMEAKPNDRGEFQFSQMKPGRYYLLTTISAIFGGSHDVYAGRVSTDFGSAAVYTNQNFTFTSGNAIGKFVDVQDDGDRIKVTLQPRISPFRQAGLAGSILGCRKLPGMAVHRGL